MYLVWSRQHYADNVKFCVDKTKLIDSLLQSKMNKLEMFPFPIYLSSVKSATPG